MEPDTLFMVHAKTSFEVNAMPLHFEDYCLEQAIRNAPGFTGTPSGPILTQHVEKIQDLDLHDKGVETIAGIQQLPGLLKLDMSQNPITDLSPLKSLVLLEWLDFSANLVTDIDALENLLRLRHLNASDNHISDISPLLKVPSLCSGARVDLRENFLDLSEGSPECKDIQALLQRGVQLHSLPQKLP